MIEELTKRKKIPETNQTKGAICPKKAFDSVEFIEKIWNLALPCFGPAFLIRCASPGVLTKALVRL